MNPQSHPKQSQLRTVLTIIANPGEMIANFVLGYTLTWSIRCAGRWFHWLFSGTPPWLGYLKKNAFTTAVPGTEPPQAARFCQQCGVPLKACRKFCTKCGTPVEH
jgi:hypothetical protein